MSFTNGAKKIIRWFGSTIETWRENNFLENCKRQFPFFSAVFHLPEKCQIWGFSFKAPQASAIFVPGRHNLPATRASFVSSLSCMEFNCSIQSCSKKSSSSSWHVNTSAIFEASVKSCSRVVHALTKAAYLSTIILCYLKALEAQGTLIWYGKCL